MKLRIGIEKIPNEWQECLTCDWGRDSDISQTYEQAYYEKCPKCNADTVWKGETE